MPRNIVRTLAAALLALSLHCTASGLTVSESKDGIVFSVSLPRASFIQGEPVIATFSICNTGKTERRLAEPTLAHYHIVDCSIFGTVGGKDVQIGADISYDYAPLPPDYGWVFRGGETRSSQVDLMLVQGMLAPGNYSVAATYRVPQSVQGVWQGEIKTPRLPFKVTPAAGINAKPANLFREARNDAFSRQTAERAVSQLRALSAPSKGGAFSRYAGYYEAYAHSTLGNQQAFRDTMRKYVDTFPTVPFYSRSALSQLALSLFVDGKYEEAKKVYERMPNGYERADGIRLCDKALAEKH